MKSLVTGGCGYFGQALVEGLVREGHAVRVFDLASPDEPVAGVAYLRGDVRDAGAVAAACRGRELVFHAVAQVPLAKDAELFWSVNRDGTENLLRAALESGVRKVVALSSSAVYGRPVHLPLTEDSSPSPVEEYGRAKLAGEALCREYSSRGLDVAVLRPRTVLGRGRLGIFQILFEWIYRGAPVPVLGRGDNRYQFVHADDLADACLKAAAKPGSAFYNCGAERFGTMRQALEALCRHARTGSRVVGVPALPALSLMRLTSSLGLSPLGDYHRMYGADIYFDVSRAARELAWRPRYSNEEMILESYDWYVRHRDQVLSGGGASAHRSRVRPGVLTLASWLLRLLPAL